MTKAAEVLHTSQSNLSRQLADLEHQIANVVSNAKKELSNRVSQTITDTYWMIGKYIVEYEQDGNVKAVYGDKMLT